MSWSNAIGRTGSVLGSMVGGYLLSLGWSLATVFAIAAAPALLAGFSIFAKGRLPAAPDLVPATAVGASQVSPLGPSADK